jgi:exopolyphosphatase/guanosine-5'-triphosphate,3'-diphosphate pyrophosphatase
MAEIIPRWEWRTFGTAGFGASETMIRATGQARVRESRETYILSSPGVSNTKVRDGLMDIKMLETIAPDKLEQWKPVLKAAFPLGRDALARVFAALRVAAPALARDTYTLEQFQDELVGPWPELRAVAVTKERHGFTIDDCIVEIANVTFDGMPPERVIATVHSLELERFENINYLRAMMSAVGMA